MSYNILEARIEFENEKLSRVIVLVEISKGDVRAIYATATPRNGYTFIQPCDTVSNELLQRVAGYGMTAVDRDTIFPNWKAKRNPGAGRLVE
jgi:hypothetical protein